MLPLGRSFHVRGKGAHDRTHAIERIVDDVSQLKHPEILPQEASLLPLLFANAPVPNASARRLSLRPFADAIIPNSRWAAKRIQYFLLAFAWVF
jgi:hypothetical protein